MNRGKKIEVSASTLVNLKAELFRKQQELKHTKASRPNVHNNLKVAKKLKPSGDSLGKSNPGIESRLAKDQQSQVSNEDQDALAASRKKLEEKARLYEKLMTTTDFKDEDEIYMVDFQRKALPVPLLLKSTDSGKPNEEKEELVIHETSYQPKDETEPWVDYEDFLGRSRRCLKRDLPKMIAINEDLKRRQTETSPQHETQDIEADEEEEDDYDRQWDALVEEQQAPVGPVHYQNVQHNEQRTHGVGYYAFSQSAEERRKQMDMLNQLRNQTKEQRARSEKLKEKRQTALKARLQKVKQRKKLQSGGTLSDSDESNKEDAEKTKQQLSSSMEKPQETTDKVEVPQEEKKEKPPGIRPWDRGKIGAQRVIQPFRKASQREWVERQREERISEFAPPQFYHKRDHVEEMRQFFIKEKQENVGMCSNDGNSPEELPPPTMLPAASFTTALHPSAPTMDQQKYKQIPLSTLLDNIPLPSDIS